MNIIDSHVHIFEEDHLPEISWQHPELRIYKGHNVDDYTGSAKAIVHVEVDRRHNLKGHEWQGCIDEAIYAASFDRVKAITAWAPMPLGPDILQAYLVRLPPKVTAIRYLLQDKPRGIVAEPSFLNSLKLLAEKKMVFEFGIDMNGVAEWQLDDTLFALRELQSFGGIYVIDHMAKPPFRHVNRMEAWKKGMAGIAAFPTSYCKLSGLLTELPVEILNDTEATAEMVKGPVAWVLEHFKGRVMYGSNAPVCYLASTCETWESVVARVLELLGVSEGEKKQIWSLTASKVHSIL